LKGPQDFEAAQTLFAGSFTEHQQCPERASHFEDSGTAGRQQGLLATHGRLANNPAMPMTIAISQASSDLARARAWIILRRAELAVRPAAAANNVRRPPRQINNP
jgi:hypothetical protein